MLHELLKDMNIDKVHNYRYLETSAIESACSEIEVEKLQDMLRKYTSTADMFTQQYLHGKNENIKLLVDIGKAVDSPETAGKLYNTLRDREPLYFRCLVEVFNAWVKKTEKTSSPSEINPDVSDVSITDLKEQLTVP